MLVVMSLPASSFAYSITYIDFELRGKEGKTTKATGKTKKTSQTQVKRNNRSGSRIHPFLQINVTDLQPQTWFSTHVNLIVKSHFHTKQ